MKSVIEACLPRKDILEGTFNPEIFTAGLSQVMDFYRGKASVTHNIYTDAGQFFSEGTYPTKGPRLVAKLGLIFRLQLRLKEQDRVELPARRVAKFTGEEASYRLSRILHFGADL